MTENLKTRLFIAWLAIVWLLLAATCFGQYVQTRIRPERVKRVPTVAALASSAPSDGDVILLEGYITSQDGGGQVLVYDRDSAATVNSGFVFNGPGSVGRYLAVDQTEVDLRKFGATGDGTTNDAARITAAGTAAAGKTLIVPPGTYRVTSTISLGSTVAVDFRGGIFQADATITINGRIIAPPQAQLFSGTMTNVSISTTANPEISANWLGALGDGTTDNRSAIQETIRTSSGASRGAYIGPGIYGIGGTGVVPRWPVRIRGAGMNLTTLKALTGATFMFQTSGAAVFDWLIVEDMTIDANLIGTTGFFIDRNGTYGRVAFRRCRFINFPGTNAAISFTGTSNWVVEDCIFEGPGNATGNAITLSGSCKRWAIRGNQFRYLRNGIIIDTGTSGGTEEAIAEDGEISGNLFEGGWWLLTSKGSGSGATVSYTSTVLTDTGANFNALSPALAVSDTIRIMPVLETGASSTLTRNSLTDAAATFVSNGVKRGHIVRAGTAFGVVASVTSETQIHVEEWLSDTNRLPVDVAAAIGAYTVYGIYLGHYASHTATTITAPFGWRDLDGNGVTPPAETRYEVLATHPNYHLNCEHSARNIRVTNNRFIRGWSDQLSTFGYRFTIIGNEIESGMDMGITLFGFGHVVTGNRIRHQGSAGIASHTNDSDISHNNISKCNWMNATAQIGDIYVDDSERCKYIGNNCDADGSVTAQRGISFYRNNDANTAAFNKFRNHTSAGIYVDQATTMNTKLRENEYSGSGSAVIIGAATGTDLKEEATINDTDGATLTLAQAFGQTYTNTGAGGAQTFNLPAVQAGMRVTFLLSAAQDVTINPDNADTITGAGMTGAAGDAISSDAAIGSWITLKGIDSTSWIVQGFAGTWSDVN